VGSPGESTVGAVDDRDRRSFPESQDRRLGRASIVARLPVPAQGVEGEADRDQDGRGQEDLAIHETSLGTGSWPGGVARETDSAQLDPRRGDGLISGVWSGVPDY
jgi:hypothetical protein